MDMEGVRVQVSKVSAVVLLCVISSPLCRGQQRTVEVRGAASMVFVAQKLQSFYETESPGFPVEVNVSTTIGSLPPGGGSVWQHLGPTSATDKRALSERFGSPLQEVPIGIEGVLVILN